MNFEAIHRSNAEIATATHVAENICTTGFGFADCFAGRSVPADSAGEMRTRADCTEITVSASEVFPGLALRVIGGCGHEDASAAGTTRRMWARISAIAGICETLQRSASGNPTSDWSPPVHEICPRGCGGYGSPSELSLADRATQSLVRNRKRTFGWRHEVVRLTLFISVAQQQSGDRVFSLFADS